ncbi:hypothetical protein DK846_09395 [Methanospirillum lacunae]|uniref:Uncharacterized protein n=1 Tax=Methanospirillum lacunae TaxID=668570 RepID=A0A2V2MXQ0_9EURY|nr:hypothetical protein DK846_09395 [Methanospirillum lacunae]
MGFFGLLYFALICGTIYPVKVVIYSHPHADHYQGVKEVTTDETCNSGDVQIIAPKHFMKHA